MEIQFPNVRRCILPDPGYTIYDADLSGADARVVAWDADDRDLMEAFNRGLNVHIKNATDAFPERTAIELVKHNNNLKNSNLYDIIKRAVHATNYGARPATLAKKCMMSLTEAEDFQAMWLVDLHPAISDWHERIEYEIQTTGRTTNKMGGHIDWFDRPDDSVWRQALAWGPQSTVAEVAAEAQIILDERVPDVEFLIQVHDSLIFQIENSKTTKTLRQVKTVFDSIVVPYPQPLIIPWDIKHSRKSWGDCTKADWSELL